MPVARAKPTLRRQHPYHKHPALAPTTQSLRHLPLHACTAAVFTAITLLASGYTLAAENDAGAASAQATDEKPLTLENVTITARNREEIAQDVPIPVSIIGRKTLERDNVLTIDDLIKKAPGLGATTPNARRTGISLRGVGKASGNDSMEAAVGIIVDGVVLSHVGMSYQDFTDLDRVEVLRGPQGTLLGKNTTIGAINYVSKAPSFKPEASANLSVGTSNSRSINASISNAIEEDVLAYRASFFADRQDGDLENINAEGGRWHEKNRFGGRTQFLLTPTSSLSVKLNLDYAESNEKSNTKPVMEDPQTFQDAAQSPRVKSLGGNIANQNKGTNTLSSLYQRAYFGGYQPLIGSWDQIDVNQAQPLLTKNQGAAAEINWDINGYTVTSITAARGFDFDARNDNDQTKFSVARGGTLVDAKQQSQELRLSSPASDTFDYQVGLFYMHNWASSYDRNLYGGDAGAFYAKNGDYNLLASTGAGTALLKATLKNVYTVGLTTPDTKSTAIFGQGNWHLNDKTTLTFGLRDTYESKESTSTRQLTSYDGSPVSDLAAIGQSLGFAANSQEVASAKNIRTTAVGSNFYATKNGDSIKDSAISWLFSPSYKLNSNVLLYASAAAGQKSGSVQFNSDGSPNTVRPEKSQDAELGIKSLLLNRALMLNVNLYRTTVRDYQQVTSSYDDVVTKQKNDGTLYYASKLGNIPGLKAQGVEVDGFYSFNPNLSFNFGLALNDARYTDWATATCPVEQNVPSSTTVCDNTGKQVIAAPKFTSIVGVDYVKPLTTKYSGHFWASNAYRSENNLTDTLSSYGVQRAYSVTDLGVGLIAGKFEIDLAAKNALDTKYTTSITSYSSTNGVAYDGIGPRRWVGLTLHTKI